MSDSPILLAAGPVELLTAAGEGKTPRVEILAYTGNVMNVPGWGPIVIDLSGLDISGPVALLADHRNELSGIVGTGVAEVRGGKLYVSGPIVAATEAGKQIVELGKAGFPFQASVGVEPFEREPVRPGEVRKLNGQTIKSSDVGYLLIRRGKLREVSITALGSDANTRVSVAASQRKEGTQTMSSDGTTFSTPELPHNDLRCAWDKDGLADVDRVEARLAAFKKDFGDVLPEFGRGMIRAAATGTLSWPDAEREILRAENRAMRIKEMWADRPKAPGIHASRKDIAGQATIEAALLCHLGGEHVAAKSLGDQPTQVARDMRMTSMVEILQAAWRAAGMDAPRGRDELIKASFSTASIANIVSNVQNKLLLDQWERLPILSRILAKKLSATDFKESKAVRLAVREVAFQELPPGGTMKSHMITDTSAPFRVDTFGRIYGLSRQDIINDDLAAFAEMPAILARGAGLKIESLFWAMVLANANEFFGEPHGNLLDAPLGLEGLGEAVSLMRRLTDDDGEPILCEPKYLVVPPALEAIADSLFASTNVVVAGTGAAVETRPAGSPFAGKYQPLVSPYLSNAKYDNNSEIGWYLFSDPNAVPAFGVAYLGGVDRPVVEQQDGHFDQLGVQFRGYLDFGCCQLDHQGAVFSSGDGGE